MAAATPRTLVLLLALLLLAGRGSAIRLPGFQQDCSGKEHKARAGSVVLDDAGFAFWAAAEGEGACSEAAAPARGCNLHSMQLPLPLYLQSVSLPRHLAEAVAAISASALHFLAAPPALCPSFCCRLALLPPNPSAGAMSPCFHPTPPLQAAWPGAASWTEHTPGQTLVNCALPPAARMPTPTSSLLPASWRASSQLRESTTTLST